MRIACLVLAGCASAAPPPKHPDFSPIATEEPTARGQLYAACVGDAVANKRVGSAKDKDTTLLVFTCGGDPARAFFDALGPWSAKLGSEAKADGSILRSTNRVQRNLFGVDYCKSDGAVYQCVIALNTGAFTR